MKLSAPIPVLKQQAKALSRAEKLRLSAGLDRIAIREGFRSWSHLAAAWQPDGGPQRLHAQLAAGELVLLAARPYQGKTLMGLGLAVESLKQGREAAFFTLDYTQAQVEQLLTSAGGPAAGAAGRLRIDTSDDLSSAHVAQALADAPAGMLVVIDYLQLLDQRRDNPPLADQVLQLKAFAQRRSAIVVCLAQIARDYQPSAHAFPGLQDVRLPNAADLSLFDKACFLQGGALRLEARGGEGQLQASTLPLGG